MGEFIVVFSLVSLLNSPSESKEKSTMYGKHLQCRHACAYEDVGTGRGRLCPLYTAPSFNLDILMSRFFTH